MPGTRKKKQDSNKSLRDAVERKRARGQPAPTPQAIASQASPEESSTCQPVAASHTTGAEFSNRDISGDLAVDLGIEHYSRTPNVSDMPSNDPLTNYPNVSALLTAHVSSALKEKIWNHQFIEFHSLLKKSPGETSKQTFQVVNGELIISPKEDTPRNLERIEVWSDAFVTFMSIYLERFPNEAQNLLQYFHNIRLAATKFSGWANYDKQFRLKMSLNPVTTSWNTVDPELWMLFMLPLPSASQNRSNTSTSSRPCFNYNRRGYCTFRACSFVHVCLRCHGSHPLTVCQSAVSTSQYMSGLRPSSSYGQRNEAYLIRPRNQTDRFRPTMSGPRPMGRQSAPAPRRYLGPRFFAN